MPRPIHRLLFLLCILIFELKDCHSLFIRQSSTGKCIKSGDVLIYNNKNYALPYWAVMTESCLDGKAEFHFDGEDLKNIDTGGTLAWFSEKDYKSRLSVYKGKSPVAIDVQDRDDHHLKQTSAGSLKFYHKNECALPTTMYVNRTKTCDTPKQKITFGAITDFNDMMRYINCPPKQHMMIYRADYGDFNNNNKLDLNANIKPICSIMTNCQVKSRCSGEISCELTMNNNLLPSHYCPDITKEIYTEHTCVDNFVRNRITGPNVRLSQSPLQGFIEIKDNSTWRKVVEERWDKHRQKMLCQHLGFNETDENNLDIRNIGSENEIATGDFICYNTQSSGTSCCILLEPSTSNASTTAPYITCANICDKPLLQDLAKSAFSGSGGLRDYELGKFYNEGWCATGSEYLSIDLQNEYHITRVVTMGNKNQTKWSESFTLTYNHNESLVNRKNVKIGNQNGYQASIQTIDIFNVRHIKIESTTGGDFCLRIELCGEAQLPGPVHDIAAKPSNFSANLSWMIPGAKMSSYITHFIMYLNGTQSESTRIVKISRMRYGNEFVLRGLKAYTEYTIGIQAQDGSLKNATIVYQSFKTEEAVPSGPPLNVTINSRTSESLGISWKEPDKNFWNGKLTGYQVCYNSSVIDENRHCFYTKSSILSYNISKLQPSTKYFVTVAASTKIGYGNKSLEISKITNAEPVNPTAISYSRLSLDITKQAEYITGVMVVVQNAESNAVPSENFDVNKLKPYSENKKNPYVTAYLNANVLPSVFVIGDGKEYNSQEEKYSNKPLKETSSYIVFLRFFEDKHSFYSTEWSSSVQTMARPLAPDVNITYNAIKTYTINWFSKPPDNQYVIKYHITFTPPNGKSKELSWSSKNTSYSIPVEYDEKYTFAIQVETNAGKSETTSKSWYSYSEPLKPPQETKRGYKITLKEPKEKRKIKTVALIMLQQSDSKSSLPPPEELVKLEDSPPNDKEANNVAFIVVENIPIKDFENGKLEILLNNTVNHIRRKRSNTVDEIQLITNATYRFLQRNTDESNKHRWSYWSELFVYTPINVVLPTISNPGPGAGTGDKSGGVGAAVGATVAVLVIVIVLVLAFVYLKRRGILQRYSGKESVDDLDEVEGIENGGDDGLNGNKTDGPLANDDIYSNQTGFVDEAEHPAVPVGEFAHYVNEMKAKENYAFTSEYEKLPANMNTSWEVAKRSFNKQKNRYGNIVTYDHCRVLLSGDENEDYINASYIDGIKTNSYIASQGPTNRTVNDMWRMVWEQNTYSIVMVTSLVELGKSKCEKYWPDTGSKMYGDIEVTLMKTEEFADHVTHTLELKKDGEEREVRHYYFQSWPDHGVPKYPTQLLAFRRHFRTHHLEQSGPIIVHCSAGVGRTGVFLAIDTILDKLEKGVINSIDVFGQVCAMRERRMNMVQTLEQYIFIHEAILETILCGMNEVDSGRIQIEVTNLVQVQANGITGFQEKFKRLCEVSPKLSNEECMAGLLEENYNKNRNKNIYPAECSRVALQYVNGEENSDYINAVFVDGFLGRNYFIATQSPLPNTITDFWRLVHLQKSSTIVLLNNVKDGTSFPRFWPTRRGEPTHYGSMTVQLDSEGESSGIWTRKFIISPYPDLSDGDVVSMFHYTKWPDHRVPANGSGVITLTSLVEKSRQSHGEGPVIVACSDGAGRTGTYIAISNLLERMKIEQAMDVFQSIKIIRGTRPQFVENAEQYQFCYTAVMAYLDAFSEYANFE